MNKGTAFCRAGLTLAMQDACLASQAPGSGDQQRGLA